LPERVAQFHIFYSTDDERDGIRKSVTMLLEHFPNVIQHSPHSMGHFCFEDMKTDRFPDLLTAVSGRALSEKTEVSATMVDGATVIDADHVDFVGLFVDAIDNPPFAAAGAVCAR